MIDHALKSAENNVEKVSVAILILIIDAYHLSMKRLKEESK